MTPAIQLVRRAGVGYRLHEYPHDPAVSAYGLEAAEKLAVDVQRVFKTLLLSLDERDLAVAVLPVDRLLGFKQMARAAGVKRVQMADKAAVMRTTGYVVGGVSPLGQKRRLPTFIDLSAQQQPSIFVSAGRRGVEIELDPEDLRGLCQGVFAAITQ
jgi:Cys-tRNA(Pro)/Cys-tRNA(Cys) deacylase